MNATPEQIGGAGADPLRNASPAHAFQEDPTEPHAAGLSSRLNWLRAGVLGANDGIVSTAGLVIGVAAATTARDVRS